LDLYYSINVNNAHRYCNIYLQNLWRPIGWILYVFNSPDGGYTHADDWSTVFKMGTSGIQTVCYLFKQG